MIETEFQTLIENIESGAFDSSSLKICADTWDGERIEDGLNDQQTVLLANALKKNPSIKKLDLSCNSIKDDGAIALATVSTLEELTLYDNLIGIRGGTALANSNLSKLSLEGNGINFNESNKEQLLKMISALINNKTITHLNLSQNYFPSEMIAQLIKNNTTIKHLFLTKFLDDGALEFISENVVLEMIHLPRNQITDMGAQYISQNNSLRELSIEKSEITDKGAAFLSKHPMLKKLYLTDSDITTVGLQSFIGSSIEQVLFSSNLKHYVSKEELYEFYMQFQKAKNSLTSEIDIKEELSSVESTEDTSELIGNLESPIPDS